MNLNSVMRLTYVLGWVSAIVAVLGRGLEMLNVHALDRLPASSRGFLFFAGFMFLATMATAAYAQAQATKGRGTAA